MEPMVCRVGTAPPPPSQKKRLARTPPHPKIFLPRPATATSPKINKFQDVCLIKYKHPTNNGWNKVLIPPPCRGHGYPN